MAVSSTSIRGFSLHKSIDGSALNGANLEYIIDNSQTITLGDAVRIDTSGYVKRAATTGAIMGIVVGLVDANGINIFETGRVPATSIAGSTLTPQDTVAVSSTNTSDTTRNIKAQIPLDPEGALLWRNQANNTGLTVTNLLQFYNTTTAGQIDTTSNSDTAGQFQLISLDPDGDGVTSKGLFRICQQQMATNVATYGTTPVRAA